MKKGIVSAMVLIVLLASMLMLTFHVQPVHGRTITVPDDYPTIQEAINAAFENDTISVKNGTYYENVVVNKIVSLVGENALGTVIDGGYSMDNVVAVTANSVNVSGFTIRNSGAMSQGIYLQNTINDNIIGNNVVSNYLGIDLYTSHNSSVSGNNITGNEYGISLYSSNCNTVLGNNITTNNQYAFEISYSFNNTFSGNNIGTNNGEGVILGNSSDNRFFHNNFIDNAQQVDIINPGWANIWDIGYPSGGNYWSDYIGVDQKNGPSQDLSDSDGIGDTKYAIDSNNTDRYPLIAPITVFDAGTWNGVAYNVDVVSNSTLSHFHFNPDEGAFVSFWVKGETVTETFGFCRVAIPKDLLWVEDGWTVLYGSYPLSYETIADENYTYLYFTYQNPYQSVKTAVSIYGTHAIPEFPSFLILPLFMIATLTAVIVYRRKHVAVNRE
jgi:parallel beta-helix repeat protein